MADEQELRIVATLDDRASAGLNRLQGNVRALGGGQQAQAMEGLRRQSGEVAGGLQQLSSGFSSAALGMTTFTALAAAVPVALAGMAASFVASGVGEFADKLNRLSRQAYSAGQDLAQYRVNLSTLMTAGITEQDAAAMLQRFTDAQVELAQRGSQLRNQIIAATPTQGRAEMEQWLANVMVAPAEDAMEMVRQRGEQIREGAGNQARAQAAAMNRTLEEQNRAAERAGAEAQRTFLRMFGAEALAHVTEPFRKATEEERALNAERAANARAWEAAMRPIRSAWTDIKETIAATTMAALLPDVQTLARYMRMAADAVRVVEQWFKNPEGGNVTNLMQQMERGVPGLESSIRPLREFLEDPPTAIYNYITESLTEGFTNMGNHWAQVWEEGTNNMREKWGPVVTGMQDSISGFFTGMQQGVVGFLQRFETEVPRLAPILRPVREFFEAPGEAIMNLLTRIRDAAVNLIPQPVIDFLQNPGEALVSLFNRVRDAAVRVQEIASNLVPESVRNFFSSAVEAANEIPDSMQQIGDAIHAWAIQPIIDFFEDPAQGFFNMVNWILDRFESIGRATEPIFDFFRNPAQGLLTLVNQIADKMTNLLPGWARNLLGVGGGGEAAAGGGPIIVPAQVQQQLAEPPPASFDERFGGFQTGGSIRAGQTGIVGEAGPELFTPSRNGAIISNDALRWGLWGASQIASLAGAGRGVGGVGHAMGRAHAMEGAGLGDIARGVIPGMGLLETMRRDEMQEGNPLRTRLRAMLGIDDPGEPTRWQQSRLDLAQAAADLDESAAQQVNVSGTGRIRVDVRAPEGTQVDANGEGLFKTTEIMRQTQMLPADYGPAAATGVNAGAGSTGNGTLGS